MGEHGRGFASRSIVFGVAFFAHGERYNKRAFGLFPIPHLEIAHSGLKHGHGTGKRPHRRAKPVGVHGFLILAVGLTASGEPHPETGIVVIVQAQPGKDGFGVLVVAGRVQVISKAIQ